MNQGQSTPVGQSAVSAGQSVVKPKPEDDTPVTPAGVPVEGHTPVGETAQTAPPLISDPVAQAAQRTQNVGNLSILARQAIATGLLTMTVDPKIVADFCTEYDRMSQQGGGTVAPPDGSLETAKEEGRREAMAEFASEKADLLQTISDLKQTTDEAPASDPMPPGTPDPEGTFKGPGQQ